MSRVVVRGMAEEERLNMSLIEVYVFAWRDSSSSSLLMPKVSSNAHLRCARISWDSTHYVEVPSIPRRFRILSLRYQRGVKNTAIVILHYTLR
jgi:hypothetical protein